MSSAISSIGWRRSSHAAVALTSVVVAGATVTASAGPVSPQQAEAGDERPPSHVVADNPLRKHREDRASRHSARAKPKLRDQVDEPPRTEDDERSGNADAPAKDDDAPPRPRPATGVGELDVEEEPEEAVPEDPRELARLMLGERGWDSNEYECLDGLYESESGWDPTATNPYSGAYGIPQSLPPEKMAAAGDDWRDNPATQLEWGLDYIADVYGTPCSAWGFKQANNWY